jgi:hypothetical protein
MEAAVASAAMEEEPPELPLQLALRLEQFHPQALRDGDEARLISRIRLVRLLA